MVRAVVEGELMMKEGNKQATLGMPVIPYRGSS